MSQRNGDKARYNRERRKRIARRRSMRELRATLAAKGPAKHAPARPADQKS